MSIKLTRALDALGLQRAGNDLLLPNSFRL